MQIFAFNISAKLSTLSIDIVSFAYIFVSPLPTKEFTFKSSFNIWIPSAFSMLLTISTSSFEYILISTSIAAFIPIFLPFITFASIDFNLVSNVQLIPSLAPETWMFSEKSKLVFNPRVLSLLSSAMYIIYVLIFPSILTLSSNTSFL